jgi:hypothetical protein
MLALFLAVLAVPAEARASRPQVDRLWTAMETAAPGAAPVFSLDREGLDRILEGVPLEGTGATAVLAVPFPDGTLRRFRVVESPIMAPELAQQFPGINTYAGRGIDDPAASMRFDRTPLGFHATVVTPEGVIFVEPLRVGETEHYRSYRFRDTEGTFRCLVRGGRGGEDDVWFASTPLVASGPTLRTYRLAVAATGEYTQFYGSQANAMAGITSTVNSVNAIYNVDVAVRLTLIANNNLIVYTDPLTDPFPLIDQNAETQAEIDGTIGDANYDVGHLFHAAGFSGNAGCIACVCSSGNKGSGWSQDPNPGDGEFTFLVAHEMGHQHGGTHTFNGINCSASQYTGSSAWEPGSGTTIMSYSSICGADNVQGAQRGDLYFHAGSRGQIVNYTSAGGGSGCGTTSATGNNVPIISAGPDRTIPRGTPFVLTATANDPDGEPLTFAWEQFDLGPTAALNAVDQGSIPLFRSFPPVTSASRTFPRFNDLLAGNVFPAQLGEQLPSTNRSLNFKVTARDNRVGGGAAEDDQMTITVSGDPFAVTFPGVGDELECGVPNTITWSVGGGSVAPTVDIRLSTNGGSSFPAVLAAGTANDGSQSVNVPATLSNDARVKIDSVGNIFFALSRATSIEDTLDPAVSCPSAATVECSATGGTPAADPQLFPFFAGASATDACDASPAISHDAPSFFPLGATGVQFTATDDSGNDDSCNTSVTVQDTTAPLITCPANVVVECTGNNGILASDPQLAPFFAGASATDVCDATLAITNNAPAFFPLGSTPVTFTATDDSGNSTPCVATVTVQDTLPPVIAASVSPSSLWPPNHKLVNIAATVGVTDICDPSPTFVLTSIASNEPDNGTGDGDTVNDIQDAAFGTPDTAFRLRAERAGPGSGRIYTIVYTGSDGSGNTASDLDTVVVPHNRGGLWWTWR